MGHDIERRALAAACRRLAGEGLVPGTSGNVSVRVGDALLVSPSGGVLGRAEPEDALLLDAGGVVLEGDGAPTSELALHRAIYALGEEAGAVVHTHAPYATALSCVLDEVPAVHYGMLALGGSVRVAPYATFGTDALAEAVRTALAGGRRAALMANHGAVCFAADVDTAVELMVGLEWACALYQRAAAVGAPRALGEAALRDVAAEADRRSYPGLSAR